MSGEPGIGKTRLVAHLARIAHDEGATVLYGRCDAGVSLPYRPFVEALHDYVAAVSTEDLASYCAEHGSDSFDVLPEITRRLPDIAPPLASEHRSERYLLFEAYSAFLRTPLSRARAAGARRRALG